MAKAEWLRLSHLASPAERKEQQARLKVLEELERQFDRSLRKSGSSSPLLDSYLEKTRYQGDEHRHCASQPTPAPPKHEPRLSPHFVEMLTDPDPAFRLEAAMSLPEMAALAAATPFGLGGIGISIARNGSPWTIHSISRPGAAYDAGLREGDRILAIDGESASTLEFDELIYRIRGTVGATVYLTISSGTQKPQTVSLVRRQIAAEDTAEMIGGVCAEHVANYDPRVGKQAARCLMILGRRAVNLRQKLGRRKDLDPSVKMELPAVLRAMAGY